MNETIIFRIFYETKYLHSHSRFNPSSRTGLLEIRELRGIWQDLGFSLYSQISAIMPEFVSPLRHSE